MPFPTARAIRRALSVLESLPPEALGLLAERLIERLDAAEPDPDREEEWDQCEALDDEPRRKRFGDASLDCGPGDPDDAEEGGDDEPDDEDRGLDEQDGPLPAAWYYGAPVAVQTVRAGRVP